VAFEPARELELEQHHAHAGGGASGQTHEIVDRHWSRSEQGEDAGSVELVIVAPVYSRRQLLANAVMAASRLSA
jgi:hypothetical protein